MDWGFFAFAIASSLSLAAGGVFLIAGYIGTVPAAFACGLKTGLPTLFVPVIGPLWFALRQGPDFRRSAWQLMAGLVLVLIAGAMIYWLGPYFAERLAAELIEAAKNR